MALGVLLVREEVEDSALEELQRHLRIHMGAILLGFQQAAINGLNVVGLISCTFLQ